LTIFDVKIIILIHTISLSQSDLIYFPRSSEQLTVGAHDLKDRSTDDVERFLTSIRFENRGKIEELELYI